MKKNKNRKIVGIALVLCVVLIGGALTTFVSTIGNPSDGRLELPVEEHENCVFSLSTGVVPASEDPDGKGYEFFACKECGEMKRIIANHESGHCFMTLADGTRFCSCGTKLGTVEKTLGKNTFSSLNEDICVTYLDQASWSGICLVDLDNDGEYDVWDVAKRKGQFFLRPDSISYLKNLISGTDDIGNVIDSMSISFDFEYTGDFSPNEDNWEGTEKERYVFWNYQCDITPWVFSLYFEPVDGKIKVYERLTTDNFVELLPDVKYTFSLLIEPENNSLFLTVTGDELPTKVLFDVTSPYPPLSSVMQLGFGRATYYCSDGSYGLYIDNLEIGCSLYTVDESLVNVVNHCDHDFTVKGIIDYDHPASEKWKKYTCKDCGCWYYGH